MSRRRDDDYLRDITEAMRRVSAYITGVSSREFMADKKTQDAIV